MATTKELILNAILDSSANSPKSGSLKVIIYKFFHICLFKYYMYITTNVSVRSCLLVIDLGGMIFLA